MTSVYVLHMEYILLHNPLCCQSWPDWYEGVGGDWGSRETKVVLPSTESE